MFLGTLGASLLRNILAGKGAIATSQGRRVKKQSVSEETKSKRQSRGIVRGGYGNKKV